MSVNFIDPNDPFLTMIRRNNFVILDTETTGLYYPAEIIQVAILDFMGGTILDTLVKPIHPIPLQTTKIHGITDEMVASAPTWESVRNLVYESIVGKDVVIYDASFDLSIIESTDQVLGAHNIHWREICDPHCAMLWYADLYGQWDDYHGNNRWQKLTDAMRQIKLKTYNAHTALGDCEMTYRLIKHLLAKSASDHLLSQFLDPTLPRDE